MIALLLFAACAKPAPPVSPVLDQPVATMPNVTLDVPASPIVDPSSDKTLPPIFSADEIRELLTVGTVITTRVYAKNTHTVTTVEVTDASATRVSMTQTRGDGQVLHFDFGWGELAQQTAFPVGSDVRILSKNVDGSPRVTQARRFVANRTATRLYDHSMPAFPVFTYAIEDGVVVTRQEFIAFEQN